MAVDDGFRTSAPPTMGPTGRPIDGASLTGLDENEAKAFGNMFVVSFLGFLIIAIIAHYLVWQWRPWIPGAAGYLDHNLLARARDTDRVGGHYTMSFNRIGISTLQGWVANTSMNRCVMLSNSEDFAAITVRDR